MRFDDVLLPNGVRHTLNAAEELPLSARLGRGRLNLSAEGRGRVTAAFWAAGFNVSGVR